MGWLEGGTIVACAIGAGISIWCLGVWMFGPPYPFSAADTMRQEMDAYHAERLAVLVEQQRIADAISSGHAVREDAEMQAFGPKARVYRLEDDDA